MVTSNSKCLSGVGCLCHCPLSLVLHLSTRDIDRESMLWRHIHAGQVCGTFFRPNRQPSVIQIWTSIQPCSFWWPLLIAGSNNLLDKNSIESDSPSRVTCPAQSADIVSSCRSVWMSEVAFVASKCNFLSSFLLWTQTSQFPCTTRGLTLIINSHVLHNFLDHRVKLKAWRHGFTCERSYVKGGFATTCMLQPYSWRFLSCCLHMSRQWSFLCLGSRVVRQEGKCMNMEINLTALYRLSREVISWPLWVTELTCSRVTVSRRDTLVLGHLQGCKDILSWWLWG